MPKATRLHKGWKMPILPQPCLSSKKRGKSASGGNHRQRQQDASRVKIMAFKFV